ncbi:fimbrial protein [Shewanella sp. MR-4]|uniref:fimbrial protein n=1 Tax=Shewanella sp. (strain MR-4) TaxID=60480 RepID=UPI00030BB1B7|nr:fimbrial protein [Shewanella sp. MR-4]
MRKTVNFKWIIPIILWGAQNQSVYAFYCSFSSTTTTIKLSDVANIGDEIVLYNLAGQTCSGWGSPNYLDALRVYSFTEYNILQGSGLSVFYVDNGYYYKYPEVINRCVWPWSGSTCPYSTFTDGTYPVRGRLVLRRTGTTASNVTIPANSKLAEIGFQQRGYSSSGPAWSSNVYKISVSNSDALSFPTCDVDIGSQNQTIAFSPVSSNQFSGIGTTAESELFSIKLNCKAGVSVYATVTDSNQLGSAGPNLSLDPSSSAAGVGIQVLYNGAPLGFGVANQFYVAGNASTPEVSHIVPFEARYVQTQLKIIPGSVSAKAIISFEYL